ncbi:MAG: hypothetical protein FWF20_04025 [Betaproteobacteria bacterium]|nr:hypothetical protein [Betaproteobacteria bacterium]MCL2885945.1 hypothetical protein [Betaproteobacteria bacterium]
MTHPLINPQAAAAVAVAAAWQAARTGVGECWVQILPETLARAARGAQAHKPVAPATAFLAALVARAALG